MKCHSCGKEMVHRKDLSFNGEKLAGYRCGCGEEYFDPEAAQRVLLRAKLRKQAPLAKLGRIRSNLILRLPKELETALQLSEGEMVELKLDGDTFKVVRT